MLQASGVPDTLRVRELLTQFRGYYPAPLSMAQVVAAAGLDGLEGRMFGELSGGQQRRVLFGITVAGDPDLVVFDEPTTGLDVEARHGLWATLRGLRSGRGVVLTTHYLEEADALADRIVVIDRGVVIAEEARRDQVAGARATGPCAVRGEPGRREPVAEVTRASRGVHGSRCSRHPPNPSCALLDLDRSATEVTVTEPSLEEAFLALTSDVEDTR